MLSLRASSQTGVAIRFSFRFDNRHVSIKEYGLPRRFAPRNDIHGTIPSKNSCVAIADHPAHALPPGAAGVRIATAAPQPRNDILNYDTRLSLRTSSQTGEAIRSP